MLPLTPMLFALTVLVTSCMGSQHFPPVRHYDFLKTTHLVANPLESVEHVISLKMASFNRTFEFRLSRNHHLLLPTSTLHLHHPFGGAKQLHPIVEHPYQGSILDSYGNELGWARILFHQEYERFH